MKVSGNQIIPETFEDAVALMVGDREYPPWREAEDEMTRTRDSWTYPNREQARDLAIVFAMRERRGSDR